MDATFKLNIASGKYLLADGTGSAIDERGYSLDVKGTRPQSADPSQAIPMFRRGPQVVYGTLVAFQIRGLVK